MKPRTRFLVLALAVAGLATGATLALLPSGGNAVVEFNPEDDLCIVPVERIAPAFPHDPASGLALHAARPVPKDARCPVCGMYPARYPRWAAQLVFEDGAAHFFDSPADLFHFMREPGRYDPERATDTVAASYLTDFISGDWIEAKDAVLVIGSTITGPMRGADLPAFASAAAAETFIAERGGKLLRFDEVSEDVVAALQRTHAHQAHPAPHAEH